VNFRKLDDFLEIFKQINEIRKKKKNVNSVGPIPAHGLSLPGPTAYGGWQATRPSGPECRGLAPGRRRPVQPMLAVPVRTHRPRSPCVGAGRGAGAGGVPPDEV
jgi:hypothetical protein